MRTSMIWNPGTFEATCRCRSDTGFERSQGRGEPLRSDAYVAAGANLRQGPSVNPNPTGDWRPMW